MSAVVIAASLRVECVALRGARTTVVRTGMGRRRSLRTARRLGDAAVLVAGVAGGLAAHLRVGDLVVASEIRAPDGAVRSCPATRALAEDLRRLGLSVHCGPIASWPRLVDRAGRHHLAAAGALAVDMESAWLAPPDAAPFAVVRAISDTTALPILHPTIVRNGLAALRALRRAVPALDAWAVSAVAPVVRRDAFLTFSAQEGRLPDTASTEVT